MTEKESDKPVGYQLQDTYTTRQDQRMVGDDEAEEPEEDRDVGFYWDWRLVDEYMGGVDDEFADVEGVWFDIAIGVQVGPSQDDHNRYQATLVGRFFGSLEEQVPLHDFVQLNGVAMLLPYLRQCVSNLSDWGPGPEYYLPVVNVKQLMEPISLDSSSGWQQLREVPDLAAKLGVPDEVLEEAEGE